MMRYPVYNPRLAGAAAFVVFALSVLYLAFSIFVWWRIVRKTGFHGALSLLLFVPVVNMFLMGYLAFAQWPIEEELQRLRAGLTRPPED